MTVVKKFSVGGAVEIGLGFIGTGVIESKIKLVKVALKMPSRPLVQNRER
jgi:hypothetical protein